jgi:hypothetical protein
MPLSRTSLGPAVSMTRALAPAATTDTSGITAITRPDLAADMPCTLCRYRVSGKKAPEAEHHGADAGQQQEDGADAQRLASAGPRVGQDRTTRKKVSRPMGRFT